MSIKGKEPRTPPETAGRHHPLGLRAIIALALGARVRKLPER